MRVRDLSPQEVLKWTPFISMLAALPVFFLALICYALVVPLPKDSAAAFALAAAMGGFLSGAVLLLGYYHRRLWVSILATPACFALPTAGLILTLYGLHTPPSKAEYWAALPAGVVTHLVYTFAYHLHRRRTPGSIRPEGTERE